MRLARLLAPYRVTDGRRFRLSRFAPDAAGALDDKDTAKGLLADLRERMDELQARLYADNRWSLLLVFQAMDAAGKDGAIRHVLSGLNPAGCQVVSFKKPSDEELDHDFLWRCATRLPERGRIGVFNRSWYEEVLVVRVHPEILAGQRLPARLVTRRIWRERHEDIAAFERHLARNGTRILKFFLHVSRAEQRRRFLSRIDESEKNWKFSLADVAERAHWTKYQKAYADAIRATAAPHAPWFVLPADDKWAARALVGAAVVEELEGLDLRFPKVSAARRRELQAMRRKLVRD